MYLPINGRVAIIDNNIMEATPLMKIFSKNRIPYVFIDGGDMGWLPDDENNLNDIRLIFLDLNLTGDRTPDVKEVKSNLYGVLRRVISSNNFPYSIILWSKQESEYAETVKELFDKELSDRKPISIKKFVKSDYFELNGEAKENSENDLLEEINALVKDNQAYSTLIYWENKVHESADHVLQELFTAFEDDIWTNKTNFIINKLGQAYLGFKKFNSSSYVEQTKGSLEAFNNIFNDTLEHNLNTCSNLEEQPKLIFDDSKFDANNLLDIINHKLLLSKSGINLANIDYTGTVSEDNNPKSNTIFESLFNESFNRNAVIDEIPNYSTIPIDKQMATVNKFASIKRKEIRKNWQKNYVVLTPLCDKVQGKQKNIRVVKGFIINKEFKKYIDDKSEAIYISPSFYDSDLKCSRVLILNFRYFFTFGGEIAKIKHLNPLFRLRHPVISEIQSKLARHVSRQGILYTE